MRKATTPEDFWSRVQKGGTEECWPWQGAMVGGYGTISVSGKTMYVHRYAYILTFGPIPDGHHVHHREPCTTKLCCNPAHLIALTPKEHNHQPGHAAAIGRGKTHCPQGHPYTEENTRWKRGLRSCRTCNKEQDRERKRRQRSVVASSSV